MQLIHKLLPDYTGYPHLWITLWITVENLGRKGYKIMEPLDSNEKLPICPKQ